MGRQERRERRQVRAEGRRNALVGEQLVQKARWLSQGAWRSLPVAIANPQRDGP